MNDEEFAAIKATYDAVHSGIWSLSEREPDAWWVTSIITNGDGEAIFYTTSDTTEADEKFLLQSRRDMAQLIAAYERTRQQNASLRECLLQLTDVQLEENWVRTGFSQYCPYCHSSGENLEAPFVHDTGCPVTKARKLLANN